MGTAFWIRRLVLSLISATGLLLLVQLARGRNLMEGVWFSLLWGAIFAGLFTLIGYVRYRRNPACMMRPGRRR